MASHPPQSSHQGTLHFLPTNLSAFEPTKPLARTASISTILWIGGLYDTPLSVSYPFVLAQALPMTWSLLTLSLSTSGLGWGMGSVGEDAGEIEEFVRWVRERRPGGKVVIMGHSTGCQDCVEYVAGEKGEEKGKEREKVDGVILQAPVSDREALDIFMPREAREKVDGVAEEWCKDGRGEDVLPAELTEPGFPDAPITARRWLDISSPGPAHAGADDFFSSDLGKERLEKTFGRFPAETALLILEGEEDESVPTTVDKNALVKSWIEVVKASGGSVDEVNSGVVPGASHNLNNQPEEIVEGLIKRVVGFIDRLDRGEIGRRG